MSNKKIENRRKGGFGPGNGGPMGAVERQKILRYNEKFRQIYNAL